MAALVTLQDGILYLDTGLQEDQFSKTNVGEVLREQGRIAQWNGSDAYTFTPWHFTATKKQASNTIAYTATFSQNHITTGLTLSHLYQTDVQKARSASFAVCCALQTLSHQDPSFHVCGAGGIIVVPPTDGDSLLYPTLIFLPYSSFDNALRNTPAYQTEQEWFQNPYATNDRATAFTSSVLAYYALTNQFPYHDNDSQSYSLSIIDNTLIPLEYLINGIDTALAQTIQQSLTQTTATPKDIPLAQLQKELGIQQDGTIIPYKRTTLLNDQAFAAASKKHIDAIHHRIARTRFFRKYKTHFIIGIAALLLCMFGTNSYHQANKNRPSAIGLESKQVVQAYYQGINTQDPELMQAMSKGNNANTYISSVSTMFVTGKMRQAYEGLATPVPPLEWFIKGAKRESPIFGISQLSIDDQATPLTQFAIPTKGNHPLPVSPTEPSKQYTVTYYLWYTQTDHITVTAYTDTVTLTYVKNAWFITDITGTTQTIESSMSFFDDAMTARASVQNDTYTDAVQQLHNRYPYFPTPQDLVSN